MSDSHKALSSRLFTSPVTSLGLGLSLLALPAGVQAGTQTISAAQGTTATAVAGSTLTLDVQYQALDDNNTTAGLLSGTAFYLHYDSTKLTPANITNVYGVGNSSFVLSPASGSGTAASGYGYLSNETGTSGDNDTRTNRNIYQSFRSAGSTTVFPGEGVSQPLTLYRIVFNVASDFNGTTPVNFSRGFNATGYSFASVGLNITGPTAPTAAAGADQNVSERSTVTLNATASSAASGANITGYAWSQTAGTNVTLTNATSAVATFTAPDVSANETLTFRLTVTDSNTLTATDNISVNVRDLALPTASAGNDQTVAPSGAVALNGANSADSDGNITAYSWTQTSGTNVTLSGANTANATFTAPANVTDLTFMLTVTDNDNQTATDNVTVHVSLVGVPVANAGPDLTQREGTNVTLNGASSSDSDGNITAFSWAQTAGTPTVTLSGANTANATFTAPELSANTSLTFTLTVTDNDNKTDTDDVIVNLSNRLAPVAAAGPDQTLKEDSNVTLNGANSNDTDGTIATYQWVQIAGTPTVTLGGANTSIATFTAPSLDADTSLTFELTVTDNEGLSSTDSVVVNLSNKLAPVANAGADQTLKEDSNVTLSGAASSDADGTITSYLWTQTAGAPTVTLTGANTATPSFVAPSLEADTSLTFQLTVTDSDNLSATDAVIVNISNKLPPVADAGVARSANESTTVTLNATGSTDADGSVVGYAWTQTAGPAVVLSSASSAVPTFLAPAVETTTDLVFNVAVTDSDGLSSSASVNVTVTDNGLSTASLLSTFGNGTNATTLAELRTLENSTILAVRSNGTDSNGSATSDPVLVEAPQGTSLVQLETISFNGTTNPDGSAVAANATKPDALPFGVLDFSLNLPVGNTTSMVIHLPRAAAEGEVWWKYGYANSSATTRTWFVFDNATFSANRKSVTLTLVDGGLGDDDRLANGVVSDPSGLGTAPATSSSSGGGGCTLVGGESAGRDPFLPGLLLMSGLLLMRRRVRAWLGLD
ncbi:MAG: PKD domain-containing protein [Magnetococcus sp. WYHC-3]